MTPFTTEGDSVRIDLDEAERGFIGRLPQLIDAVESRQDPAFLVLNRSAYHEDEEQSAAYASLVASDVADQRIADGQVAEAVGVGQVLLDAEECRSLLRCINDARLLLAARSEAFELGPDWEQRIDTDPNLAAVAWLGWLQSELLRALPPRG